MQFTIKLSKLSGMVHLASKQDIRYYLNGVRVEFNSNKIRLIATDGHKIGVYQCDTDSIGNGAITIPREFIEKLPKATLKNDPLLTIKQDSEKPTFWHCEISNTDKRAFYEIEGNYPDYARVFHGIKTSGKAAQFNDLYLAQFKKCGLALTFLSKDHFFPIINHNGSQCALVELPTLQGQFIGGIMPFKHEDTIENIVAPNELIEPLNQNITVQNNAFITESEKLAA